jgi:DNA repair protein RecN (Recombination protein N)
MGFLDAFAPDAHRAAAADIAERYRARMRLAGSIKAARADAAGREREIDDIDRQLAEIEGAKLKPGEDEKLSARLALLENAERLRDGLSLSHALVYGGAGSAQEMLSRAVAAMERIAPVDARFEVLATRLKELTYAAQDIGYELRDALEEVESDPAALEKLSDRLDIIRRLKKRYGPELSDVLRRGDELRARRDELSGGDERAHAWRRELKDMDAALKAACAALSVSRHAVAQRLSEGVLSHLRDLGMEKTRFEIRVQPEKITATGADRVEFLISPNPGEPLKPLSAIASGGEISRVMLALKAVSTAEYGVESMVFDEIDAGVSGRMAQAVGEKIARIARSRQVLCVTHLPQIAALADRHFAVEKGQVGERTGTNVRLLDDEGRAREIARLVGGAEDEKSALAHARNLLAAAEKRRAELRQ